MKKNETLLEARGLFKTYAKEGQPLEVLKGVDFSLKVGESVAILGPSGSGKSTLLKILGSLEAPSQGEVYFQGKSLKNFSPETLSQFRNLHMGFVFQFHFLMPMLTAEENVSLPGMIKGLGKREALERARYLLEEVGLKERLDFYPNQLSGGERQRVALARAIFNEAPMILADEPTGNLDREYGQQVFELLLELKTSLGSSLLMVTHNWDLAKQCERRLELREGLLKAI
ncbi:MAG: ABC transporter ATP-binding protein [Deltaproteobacteria bacterium]|nr:ABC transporter ATP-binding protein [Deltaproteobacteria bacterium]